MENYQFYKFRKTSQQLLPPVIDQTDFGYRIFPSHHIGDNKIFTGFASLALYMSNYKTITIDGFNGVLWDTQILYLNEELVKMGLKVSWHKTTDYLLPEQQINRLIAPFLGEENAVWGTKCTLSLDHFFQTDKMTSLKPDENADVTIVAGTGAALAGWECPLVYIDLPKNEAQYRMRSRLTSNLGTKRTAPGTAGYKRMYFVDWVLLHQHKAQLVSKITIIADGQWNDTINWMTKTSLTESLDRLSHSVFRVRPWFEPGAWGGQWMKRRLKGLNKDEVNYAWSFELITPENGIVFESNGNLLEVSFDWLMFYHSKEVLGVFAGEFGTEFPIRFDFLDTFDGGNLSVQCHPSLRYIQEKFGEKITQDETYYIVDCKDDARVFLGFHEDIDPGDFKETLQKSRREGTEVDIDQYVQSFKSHQHDLFLIPNGTIHSAGKNNMVLEISATPYIFTFKMYDWLRLDLDGRPRPINIEHAFANLNFERKGERVKKELIAVPEKIEQGDDWAIYHLPTHPEHFYDVHRADFNSEVTLKTNNSCLVLMLVEGDSIRVTCKNGVEEIYHYAETFVVPAAATGISVLNLGSIQAKLVIAFLKPGNND